MISPRCLHIMVPGRTLLRLACKPSTDGANEDHGPRGDHTTPGARAEQQDRPESILIFTMILTQTKETGRPLLSPCLSGSPSPEPLLETSLHGTG